jgi:hypothetical protein
MASQDSSAPPSTCEPAASRRDFVTAAAQTLVSPRSDRLLAVHQTRPRYTFKVFGAPAFDPNATFVPTTIAILGITTYRPLV